jgi:hypothetical protein
VDITTVCVVTIENRAVKRDKFVRQLMVNPCAQMVDMVGFGVLLCFVFWGRYGSFPYERLGEKKWKQK